MTAVTIKESGKCTCDDIIIYLWERFTCEHVLVDFEDKNDCHYKHLYGQIGTYFFVSWLGGIQGPN